MFFVTCIFKCYMFILNLKVAPNWFMNIEVGEITPDPGVRKTGPFLCF